jgi:hypothetical protein
MNTRAELLERKITLTDQLRLVDEQVHDAVEATGLGPLAVTVGGVKCLRPDEAERLIRAAIFEVDTELEKEDAA